MTVLILEQGYGAAGYDVKICLSDGRIRVVHFLTPPPNAQVAVDAFETQLLDDEAVANEPNTWNIVES